MEKFLELVSLFINNPDRVTIISERSIIEGFIHEACEDKKSLSLRLGVRDNFYSSNFISLEDGYFVVSRFVPSDGMRKLRRTKDVEILWASKSGVFRIHTKIIGLTEEKPPNVKISLPNFAQRFERRRFERYEITWADFTSSLQILADEPSLGLISNLRGKVEDISKGGFSVKVDLSDVKFSIGSDEGEVQGTAILRRAVRRSPSELVLGFEFKDIDPDSLERVMQIILKAKERE
jgi:c-di-GMP-binding flagellar brake protein YcgR